MSRTSLPLPSAGRGRRVFGLVVLAVVVWFVVRDPHGAAAAARVLGHGLGRVADAIVTFVRSL